MAAGGIGGQDEEGKAGALGEEMDSPARNTVTQVDQCILSHCGWNSSLESLSRGVHLIGWPLTADQFYNSKMLDEEFGVCVELARGVEDNFEHTHVVESTLRLVLDEEKGKEMKEKALKYAELRRAAVKEEGDEKGSSLQVLDDLLSEARRKHHQVLKTRLYQQL